MEKIEFRFRVPLEGTSGRTVNSYDMIHNDSQLSDAIMVADDVKRNGLVAKYCNDDVVVGVEFGDAELSKKDGIGSRLDEGYFLTHIRVSVFPRNVEEHVVESIKRQNANSKEVAQICNDLAVDAACHALEAVKRIVRYAHNKKRQYRVATVRTSKNAAQYLLGDAENSQYVIDGGVVLPWQHVKVGKSSTISLHVTVEGKTEYSLIEATDLVDLRDFIENGRRGIAYNEFLVNSRRLLRAGQYRSCVLEAYGAIETIVNRYRDVSSTTSSVLTETHPHLNNDSLKADINNFGVSRSIKYILPLLHPELVSSGILYDILELGKIRQNVSHSGARNFEPEKLSSLVTSAEKFCDVLESKIIENKK